SMMAPRRIQTRTSTSTPSTPSDAPAAPIPAHPAPAVPDSASVDHVSAPTSPVSAPVTNPISTRDGKRGPSRGIATNKMLKSSATGKLPLPAKFDIEDTAAIRQIILAKANVAYRSWRSRLREHYELYNSDEERLQNPPKNILPETWEMMVLYFGSSKFQEKSSRNKENRKHHVVPHIARRTSFAFISRDNHNPATGEEPDIQAMWQITHQKTNGEWVNEKAKEIDGDISLMVNETYESGNPITPNEAFAAVRGEKGGASYGLKASRSKIRIQAQLDEAMQDREELTKEIDVLKEKFQEQQTKQEKKLAEMQSQLEAQ
ncbi:hypothetical protein PIB30_078107, partial [Stylosanthes scabra]|nr:hypothetical protein [Stylosanthes scabra]